jgi:hypothetical protein
MLVDFVVVLVMRFCNFVWVLRLNEVALKLVQNTNFKLSINSSFHWEITRQNTVLEIAHSLIQLVSLGQYYTKLVQKFRLLLEIRWHFKDSNQRGNCVVVRLELLI